MKTKRIEKKLNLNKTTISTILNDRMNNVKGGAIPTGFSACFPETCGPLICEYTEYRKCTAALSLDPLC